MTIARSESFLGCKDPLGGGMPFAAARQSTDGRRPRCAPVTHPYAALSFYTEGRLRIEQRGQWVVETGDVLIVPAGEPHRFIDAERASYWGLGISIPCFAADDTGDLVEPFERVRSGASVVVRIPSERHMFLEGLLRELSDAARPRGTRSAEPYAVQRSLLTLVMNEIRRAARWGTDAPGAKSVVAESLGFIERHCLRPLTLKDVAKAVGRTPAYVTTALTRATGKSAVEWIIDGRMAEARRLLLHSDERIDGIAARVGYIDPTHFIRMFRRAHGATPAAWRAAKLRSP